MPTSKVRLFQWSSAATLAVRMASVTIWVTAGKNPDDSRNQCWWRYDAMRYDTNRII